MSWLLSLITGPLLNAITGPLLEAYKARLSSANQQDAKAVELAVKEIDAEIESRKAAQAIIIAEQGRWWTAAPRSIVQWSFAIFVAKCVVYDKVFALGSTDSLQGDISSWAGMVMMMWFGGRTIEKVAQIFKR